MAGGNISPRQKMINMMYLVLTALLAMNVSAEILNAFKTVNNSIQKSSSVLGEKNNAAYKAFEDAAKDPKTAAKAQQWKPKADKAKSISAEVIKKLEDYKTEIKKGCDLKIVNGEEEFKESDLDIATRLFIEEQGGKRGDDIYNSMMKCRKEMLDILNPDEFKDNPMMQNAIKQARASFEKNLPINMDVPKSHAGNKHEEGSKGWNYSNFHMTPSIAAITILSKLQNDVKNSESQIVDYCYSQIGQVKVVYNKFEAIASANTTYCMPDEEIEIKAGVGAFSEAAKPDIYINGAMQTLQPQGYALYKFKASGSGDKSVSVKIVYTTPEGTKEEKTEVIKYTVGTPSGAAVMFDKMNVLYIGVPNPLTISSGTGAEKTNASLSTGGSLSKGSKPGSYIANVTTPTNDAKINVTADGKTTSYPVRIKRIPDPIPTLGGKIKGGKINKATLQAQGGLVALLENFDFDARFNILSFTFLLAQKGGDVSPKKVEGPVINESVKSVISRAKPGDIVIFDDIKAKGPDGTVRNLPPLNLTII